MKKNDYFLASDVKALGEAKWEEVRDNIRKMGFRVDAAYGVFARTADSTYFRIDEDDDIIGTNFKGEGMKHDPADYVNTQKVFERIKLGVYSNRNRLAVGIDYLLEQGYQISPFESRDKLLARHSSVWGVYGSSSGKIDVVQLEHTFAVTMHDYTEYSFDVKEVATLVIDNLFKVPKFVNIRGVQVNEDALTAFLETQRNANMNGAA